MTLLCPWPPECPCRVPEPTWGEGASGRRNRENRGVGATREVVQTQRGPAPLSFSQTETFNSRLCLLFPLPGYPSPGWLSPQHPLGLCLVCTSSGSLPHPPIPQSGPGVLSASLPPDSTPCFPHPSSDHPKWVVISGWCAASPLHQELPLLVALPQFPLLAPLGSSHQSQEAVFPPAKLS